MKFTGKLNSAVRTYENEFLLTLNTKENLSEDEISNLKNKEQLSIEIKEYRKHRSLNANAYCWVLCEKIAQKIKSTKEIVYKDFVKRVGVFVPLPIKTEIIHEFERKWGYNGIGWFIEIVGESKLKGYTTILAYYGSSTYDSKEMNRLLDEIIQEAKDLGIQTETPEEIAKMKSLYEQEKGETKYGKENKN